MSWQQQKFLGLFLLMLLLEACKPIGSKSEKWKPPRVYYNAKPIMVVQYLQNKFPGYHLIGKRDFAALWWSFYNKNDIPYLVSSDFNNDGVADYATIISNGKKMVLVIMLGSGSSFKHWLVPDLSLKAEENGLSYGLSIQPPAQIDAVHPEAKTLYLKNNAIMVNHYELHDRIYYYEDQTFKVFTMSEKGTHH
ncbi:hypothetical protein [Mucilaginibacter paludis]|uniref:Uncharacterized protein n=1 Tax=Mucilaginibacter paludis DSM 18603 TaxID=714943 RepID=H1YIV7_9SPHI|nr:hypothetical protein [Mucilaginibacter paludis]EHQ27652.1 hypothetical protein Mucpa_3554 [Mucilaginibacter paludis DSM 18603]